MRKLTHVFAFFWGTGPLFLACTQECVRNPGRLRAGVVRGSVLSAVVLCCLVDGLSSSTCHCLLAILQSFLSLSFDISLLPAFH